MKGWETRAIQTLVNASPKVQQTPSNSDIWNLNLDQIESHGGRILEKVYVSAEKLGPSTFPFEPRTVLYSKLRPYLNKVIVADEAGFATTELVPLRCNPDEVHPEYLAYFLRSDEFLRFATEVVAGAKMPRMVMSEFWNFQVPVPPLPEQRRIAAILDQADALRAKRREALAHLDSLTQSIFIEMFGDPVANPKKIEKATIGELVKLKSGDFLPASGMAEGGEFPVLGGNGVNGYHDQFMFEESKIVIGRVGVYCGCVHISPPKSWVTDNALYVSQKSSKVSFEYLAFSLRLARLNQYASQSAQPLISGARLNPIEILLPDIGLQTEFTSHANAVEALRHTHSAALNDLDSLFASLQHRAFAGEL